MMKICQSLAGALAAADESGYQSETPMPNGVGFFQNGMGESASKRATPLPRA